MIRRLQLFFRRQQNVSSWQKAACSICQFSQSSSLIGGPSRPSICEARLHALFCRETQRGALLLLAEHSTLPIWQKFSTRTFARSNVRVAPGSVPLDG